MKKQILLLCFISIFTIEINAKTCNSKGSGNWAQASTWDCGSIPIAGDVVNIAPNHIININCNCPEIYQITINGTLDFGNGQKINVNGQGFVQLNVGGKITGGNPGSKIMLGKDEKWRGGGPDLLGPLFIGTGVLPVELIAFEVKSLYNQVNINWTTQTETNNHYFNLERSKNGAEWDLVGTVKGNGNSKEEKHYSLFDESPLSGLSYYRLTQVDFDGSTSSSKIIELFNNADYSVKLYPNPANTNLKIEGSGIQNASVNFFNSLGQELKLSSSIENNTVNVDVSELKQGVYYVQIKTPSGKMETKRIAVK